MFSRQRLLKRSGEVPPSTSTCHWPAMTGAAIVALVFALDTVARTPGRISPEAVVQTLAIATGFGVIGTAAALWRGVITGSIRLARQVG